MRRGGVGRIQALQHPPAEGENTTGVKPMSKHWDTIFGTTMAAGTITLAHINTAIGISVGLVSLFIVIIRARKEWKNRNRD